MSKGKDPDQPRVIREVFDAANVQLPNIEWRGFTSDNKSRTEPQTEKNGFTPDNIQQPVEMPNEANDDN